ncbi:MAG TPA: hypothetical protein VF665_25690 [Longimicrobium sp.]|jgi:hypothetical protein|uniref:hypothetical protein n=1 Tax=Longimicrobium sp. TaxID=2029185 RepID=UPI002ED927C0
MSNRDNETFDTVRARHQDWHEANKRPRSRSALANARIPELSDAAEKAAGTAVGVGSVLLLFALAIVCIAAARSWFAIDRSGAGLGYSIAAFFLLLASIGGTLAIANHLFKVIPGEAPHHH